MSIYNGLIARNCAPKGAASIGVFNGNGRRVGKIPLGSLSLPADLGQKRYSFGCLSDIHIQYTTGTADLQNALTWLCQTEGVDFITVSGDLTQNGTAAHLKTYADCVSAYARRADGTAVPVYAAGGNHEARETGVETVLPAGIGLPLYYTVSGEADTEGATATTPGRNFHSDAVGQDVFIFLSILHKDQSAYNGVQSVPLFGTGDDYTGTGNTAFPSRTVLTWLYQVLEKNRDRRCFLFQHIRPYDATGNYYGIYSYDLWGNGSNKKQDAVVFESFLTHYKNILHFHGHSHLRLGLQELVEGNGDGDVTKNCNVDRKIGSTDTGWSIHVPSLTVPRTGDASGAASRQELYAESEGYVVEVYDKYILLRGRKFQTATDDSINSTESSQTTDYTGTYSPGYFLPVATYCLDTGFTAAEAGTYTDSTGIVMTDNDNDNEEEELSLTGITAAYSGGTVAAGTTLDQLTGITVTATYSDGSTATLAAGDYTLSGTLTAGQDNTVTVTYQGKTATFTVTVAAEPAGVTETEIALTWTAGKLAYAIGGAATTTNSTSDYAYAHSQRITMETGMTYKVVTGEISATKAEKPTLGKWNYRIVFVDDDNIIRATTEIQAENADNVTVENIATDPTFVAGSDVSLATGFYVREYTAGSTGGNVGNPIVNGMTDLTHLYKIG